jgi:PAS domain S-box-containing protein
MSLAKILHALTAKPAEKPVLREQRKPEALAALNIEGNSEGLWHWDLLRNKLRVSHGWAAILGWEPDDLGDRPRDWFALIHPYYVGGVRMDLAAHLKGQKDQFECEYRIRHRNGTYRWVLCRGRAVRDKRGNAIEISGVQTDVTRLIEVENRLVEDALHDRLRVTQPKFLPRPARPSSRRTAPRPAPAIFSTVFRFGSLQRHQ